jgi:hypothetical protein
MDPSLQQAVSLTHGPNTCSAVSELMISKADDHCSGSSHCSVALPGTVLPVCVLIMWHRAQWPLQPSRLGPSSDEYHACRQCALHYIHYITLHYITCSTQKKSGNPNQEPTKGS